MTPEILFVIQTYNEEQRIGHILDYYKAFGKVIVIDNYSIDDTLEITKQKNVEFHQKKNNGSTQTFEWRKWFIGTFGEVMVINCSCSEYIPKKTILEISRQLISGRAIVETQVISITDGVELNLWNSKSRYIQRGLNYQKIDISAVKIHHPYNPKVAYKNEQVRLDSKEFRIYHLRNTNFKSECIKILEYATIEAKLYTGKSRVELVCHLIKNLLIESKVLFRFKNLVYFRISIPQILLRMIMHYTIFRICIEKFESHTDNLNNYKDFYK